MEALEHDLLEEPSMSLQIATTNATLEKLISTAGALAKSSQAQLERSTGVMREHVNAFERAPELIADQYCPGIRPYIDKDK
ncbi:hypothetical protein Y032_0767g2179 [Ancylostoma ceylanicum]|nr:hypothetical protein Y032_0767g2179 [Ancylostoma ceylanicum]